MGWENLLWKKRWEEEGGIEGGEEDKKKKKEKRGNPTTPKHAACPLGSDSCLDSSKPKGDGRLENWEGGRRRERRLSPLLVSASGKKAVKGLEGGVGKGGGGSGWQQQNTE